VTCKVRQKPNITYPRLVGFWWFKRFSSDWPI